MGYDIDDADEMLDDDQARAVTREGDLMVLAGPGSGKTRVMQHRVAHVLERDDLNPRRIAAVGFTNESSNELARRIAKLHPHGRDVVAKTFHSLCYMILQVERGVDGVIDNGEAAQLIGGAFAEASWDHEESPGYVHGLFDMARSQGVDREDIPDTLHRLKPELAGLRDVWEVYEREMLDEGVVDFTGMVYRTVEAIREDPDVRRRVREQFRHLVVDECQDLDPLQYEVVRLVGDHDDCSVCLVGDPKQGIYGFRGADLKVMAECADDLEMDVVHLHNNYRSADRLVDATNNMMRARKPGGIDVPESVAVRGVEGEIEHKVFEDEREEAEYIADDLERRVEGGADPADFGVLYRTNAQARYLQIEMALRRVPFTVVKGRGFFAQSEIQEAIAYLRLARDATDMEALRQIYSTPTRYLGSDFLERLEDEHEAGEESVFDAMRRVQAGGYKNDHCVGYLLDDLRPILDSPSKDPAETLRYVYQLRSRVDADKTFKRIDGEPSGSDSYREMNLDSLRELAERFDTVEGMLDTIMDGKVPSSVGEGGGQVRMMTIHRSKGLEFPHVYVTGMTEGVLPHKKGIHDEERRIAYVATTRAEDRLVLTSPMVADESVSRFVAEMGV